MFEVFQREVLEAQKVANRKNSGVQVHFGHGSTFIKPNLPKLSKKEMEKRFKTVMEADPDDEDVFNESLSILARPSFKNKLSKSKSNINNNCTLII